MSDSIPRSRSSSHRGGHMTSSAASTTTPSSATTARTYRRATARYADRRRRRVRGRTCEIGLTNFDPDISPFQSPRGDHRPQPDGRRLTVAGSGPTCRHRPIHRAGADQLVHRRRRHVIQLNVDADGRGRHHQAASTRPMWVGSCCDGGAAVNPNLPPARRARPAPSEPVFLQTVCAVR